MTSVQNVFITPENSKKPAESAKRKFAVEEGDHLTLLNVYNAFTSSKSSKQSPAKWCKDNFLNLRALERAVSVRAQLRRYVDKFNLHPTATTTADAPTADGIRRCLTTGYFAHAARMQPDGSFRSVDGMQLWAHPSSVMFNRKADWVVFHEAVETGKKTFIRDVCRPPARIFLVLGYKNAQVWFW
jgi:ATP-dependent RNA helicase DDX35